MNRSVAPALPIKRDIGLAYISSLVVSVVIALVSVTGLVWGSDGRYGVGSPLVQVSQGAVRLGTVGAEVRMCARPDYAELLARVGVRLVPIGVWR